MFIFERETETETETESSGGTEREGDTESEAGSRLWLSAQSPTWELNSQTVRS